MQSMRILIVSLMAVGLIACSPQQLHRASGVVYLNERVSLERQRQFTIAADHKLALVLEGANGLSAEDKLLYQDNQEAFAQGLNQSMAAGFSDHFMVNSIKSPKIRNADFIVRVQLLSMIRKEFTLEDADSNSDEDASVLTTSSTSGDNQVSQQKKKKVVVHRFTAKMLLLDANSKKVLDTALIKARSGQLDSFKGYQVFARKTFDNYTRSLAPKSKSI